MKQSHDQDIFPSNAKTQNSTEILLECCKDQVQAVILTLYETKVYYHAYLVSVSGNSLCLRLTRKLFKPPAPGSACCLSFAHHNSNLSFFSNILEYHHNPPDKHAELILDIPSGIMRSELRLAYRVNVLPESQLIANLITDGGLVLRPKVRDLSLAGMAIDFTGMSSDPKLKVGANVEIEMRLPPDEVRLKGEVRRRAGSKYGILFPTVVTRNGVRPPAALKNIVSALEREWLREIGRIR